MGKAVLAVLTLLRIVCAPVCMSCVWVRVWVRARVCVLCAGAGGAEPAQLGGALQQQEHHRPLLHREALLRRRDRPAPATRTHKCTRTPPYPRPAPPHHTHTRKCTHKHHPIRDWPPPSHTRTRTRTRTHTHMHTPSPSETGPHTPSPHLPVHLPFTPLPPRLC